MRKPSALMRDETMGDTPTAEDLGARWFGRMRPAMTHPTAHPRAKTWRPPGASVIAGHRSSVTRSPVMRCTRPWSLLRIAASAQHAPDSRVLRCSKTPVATASRVLEAPCAQKSGSHYTNPSIHDRLLDSRGHERDQMRSAVRHRVAAPERRGRQQVGRRAARAPLREHGRSLA
jgi:hypothetical protein